MSSETTNLHLVKPTSADTADIGIINGNMDIIDDAVGALQESTSQILTARVCSPTSAVSFAANATTDFTIPITAVSGYTPMAISGFRILYAKLLPLQVRIEDATTISMTIQSISTTAISTANIGISVLYVRNDLL